MHSLIKKLVINGGCSHCDYDLWRFVNRTCLHLVHLDIELAPNSPIPHNVHFKGVTSFALRMSDWTIGSFPTQIPFTFKSLEMQIYEDDLRWLNFIRQNCGLVDLEITFRYPETELTISANELFQIVSALPNLEKFTFSTDSYIFREHRIFLRKCKVLKRLTNIVVNVDVNEDDHDYDWDDLEDDDFDSYHYDNSDYEDEDDDYSDSDY